MKNLRRAATLPVDVILPAVWLQNLVMTINRRIAFGAAASWLSRGVSIVLGLVLLPVLFRHLPKEELGVWLLLQQSWAALGIFDLGFGLTLTRRIAFAKGKSGSQPDVELSEASRQEVADLVTTGSRVYHLLSIFTFLFSFVVGYSFLDTIHLSTIPHSQVWLAWGIICLSQAIAVWANVWNCVLLGIGYVGWDAVLASGAQALTYLVQIVVVLAGGSLIALAITAILGALLQRTMMRAMARRFRPAIFRLRGRWLPGLVREMTPLALRAWLTSLGTALVLYTDQILITSMKGAQALPAYRAAYVLVHNVNIVAGTLGLASAVFISHLWQANELPGVHRLVERNARVGWITMLSASAFLLVSGPLLFRLWLGPGAFVGYAILAAFLVTETLDVQSYVVSASSRATEDEAFVVSSLAGGVLKLVLSYLLARELGLLGIVLGTVIALAATNHWYMVYRGLRRLKMSLREYAATVLVPCGLLFPAFLVLLFLVRVATSGLHALPQFSLLVATAAILFTGRLLVPGAGAGPAAPGVAGIRGAGDGLTWRDSNSRRCEAMRSSSPDSSRGRWWWMRAPIAGNSAASWPRGLAAGVISSKPILTWPRTWGRRSPRCSTPPWAPATAAPSSSSAPIPSRAASWPGASMPAMPRSRWK